jgi:small-conductance mechanosensitive channel
VTAASSAASTSPLIVGTEPLFNVGALPGQSAAARAAAINRRIASFVNHPEEIEPVRARPKGPEWVLAIGERDLLTVTPQDAADNLTSVPALAGSWRRELDESLSMVRAEHQTFWLQIRDSILQSVDDLTRQVAASIPRLISALLVLIITLVLAKSIVAVTRRLLRRTRLDANYQQLIRTLTYYGLWTLGWIVALGTAGIQLSTLVAGLGVTTIALGFALKDLLSNFVSGFLILTTRPFNLGDQIAIPNYEGTVERIELRATHLRTYDNRLVIIPNADLYAATITNNTASPFRRTEFVLGIDYSADLSRALVLAQKAATETPDVLDDPAPDALIDQLSGSAVNLKVRFYSDSRRGKSIHVASDVMQRVNSAFNEAGIAIYPPGTTIVQLTNGPPASSPDETTGTGSDSRASSGSLPPQPAPPVQPSPAAPSSPEPAAGNSDHAAPARPPGGDGHGQ